MIDLDDDTVMLHRIHSNSHSQRSSEESNFTPTHLFQTTKSLLTAYHIEEEKNCQDNLSTTSPWIVRLPVVTAISKSVRNVSSYFSRKKYIRAVVTAASFFAGSVSGIVGESDKVIFHWIFLPVGRPSTTTGQRGRGSLH